MNKRWVESALGVAMLIATAVQAQGNARVGATKSATCAACHGADGNSLVDIWPKLAGQHQKYLLRQLRLFKSGERENPQMSPMAVILSDEDIADLAAYYAAQTIQTGVASDTLVNLGERIYRAGSPSGVPACSACHGPAGAGNPTVPYPMLAGQHANYTAATLRAFRDGAIWGVDTNTNTVMAGVTRELSDAEIEAVASYIQGLH